MNWQNLTFFYPQASYFLIFLLLIALLFWKLYGYRQKQLGEFTSSRLLPVLSIPRSNSIFWGKAILVGLAWILLTSALMQPASYQGYPAELLSPSQASSQGPKKVTRQMPYDVIFLVDASASMRTADTPVGRTRLDSAKEIIDATIGGLTGQMVALHSFTAGTSILSPLTTDYLFVRLLLRQLRINEGGIPGTDLLNALKNMRTLYFAESKLPLKSLIILTDGGDTELEVLQGTEREARVQQLMEIAKEAADKNIRVFTVGIGSRQGASVPDINFEGQPVISTLNESLLRQLSQQGHGQAFVAGDYSAIDLAGALVNAIKADRMTIEELSHTSEDSETRKTNLIYNLYFQIPLGLALLLLAAVLLLPDSRISKSTKLAHIIPIQEN